MVEPVQFSLYLNSMSCRTQNVLLVSVQHVDIFSLFYFFTFSLFFSFFYHLFFLFDCVLVKVGAVCQSSVCINKATPAKIHLFMGVFERNVLKKTKEDPLSEV